MNYTKEEVRSLKKFGLYIGIEALLVVLGFIVSIFMMAKGHVGEKNITMYSQVGSVALLGFVLVIRKPSLMLTKAVKSNPSWKGNLKIRGAKLNGSQLIQLLVVPVVYTVILAGLFGNFYVPVKEHKPADPVIIPEVYHSDSSLDQYSGSSKDNETSSKEETNNSESQVEKGD